MPREFRYESHRIQELVSVVKRPKEGFVLKWEYEKPGASTKIQLDTVEGSFVDFELNATAGRLDDPITYRAALLLDARRIRGVDYSSIERKKHYKPYIQKGWHQNVIDPGLSSSDPNQNRHLALENFDPVDLDDFLRKICLLWHIELFQEGERLL